MSEYPITLGIAQKSRSAQNSSGTGPSGDLSLSAEIKQKIMTRDDNTCQLCGFKSKKYQDVHFVDGNPSNLQIDNLVTACVYCHQCFDLEKVAEMRSGVLVWLPEISQPDLHHIARAIYVARISQGSMAETFWHIGAQKMGLLVVKFQINGRISTPKLVRSLKTFPNPLPASC